MYSSSHVIRKSFWSCHERCYFYTNRDQMSTAFAIATNDKKRLEFLSLHISALVLLFLLNISLDSTWDKWTSRVSIETNQWDLFYHDKRIFFLLNFLILLVSEITLMLYFIQLRLILKARKDYRCFFCYFCDIFFCFTSCKYSNWKSFKLIIHTILGHSRFWLCFKSSAKTTSKTFLSSNSCRSNINSSGMACICMFTRFVMYCDMEYLFTRCW